MKVPPWLLTVAALLVGLAIGFAVLTLVRPAAPAPTPTQYSVVPGSAPSECSICLAPGGVASAEATSKT